MITNDGIFTFERYNSVTWQSHGFEVHNFLPFSVRSAILAIYFGLEMGAAESAPAEENENKGSAYQILRVRVITTYIHAHTHTHTYTHTDRHTHNMISLITP